MRAANRRLPSDGLNLVVATAPSATAEGRFLEHDLELVRASLLYADTVELLSPAAVLVGGVAAFQAAGPEGWLDVLAELDDATLRHMNVDDPNTFREALGNFREYSSLPRAGRRKQMGSQFAEAERMSDEFRRVLEEPGGPRDQIAMILDQAQAPELGEALEAGVLTLSTDSMTVGADTNTQIREYTATLASLLAKPGTHLLLDERMSGIAESLIDAGEVTPSAATMTRVVRSRVGTGLVAQLPVFPGASIGTILETRAELSEPLARYRGGVKRLSGTVESAPLSAELGAEVADMWRDEVVPAVNDLRADLATTRLAHDAALNLGRDAKSLIAGSALIFGVETFTDHSTLLAAGTAAVPVLGKAVLDAYEGLAGQRRQAKRHDLFYLLALSERLSH